MLSLTESAAAQGFKADVIEHRDLASWLYSEPDTKISFSEGSSVCPPPSGSYSGSGWGTSRTVQDVQAPQPC